MDEEYTLICPTCSNDEFDEEAEGYILRCSKCGTWHDRTDDAWYTEGGVFIWSPNGNPDEKKMN